MLNELNFLLRNVKENIKRLKSEKHLIEFLDNYNTNINLQRLNEIVKDEIDFKAIGLEDNNKLSKIFNNLNTIEYLNIMEDPPFYSVGIFFIPSSHAMPIHDHRNMLVFSKILKGEAEIISYDRIKPTHLDEDKFEVKLTEKNLIKTGEISILTPSSKNIHEIKAISPVALFDILIPDYADENACNYYKKSFENNKIFLTRI